MGSSYYEKWEIDERPGDLDYSLLYIAPLPVGYCGQKGDNILSFALSLRELLHWWRVLRLGQTDESKSNMLSSKWLLELIMPGGGGGS